MLKNQLSGQLTDAQSNLALMLRTTAEHATGGRALTGQQKLEFELEAARTELLNIKEELATERALAAQYKEMAVTQENRAREMSDAAELYCVRTDERA